MGKGGVHVRSGCGPGCGLCAAGPASHCARPCGQPGPAGPQVPGALAEEKGRLGK